MSVLLAAIIGYLIGGIPTGIWITRTVKGVDPRTLGSGSSGATNVSRVLGRKWAIIVLVLDALKGFLPVALLAPILGGPVNVIPVKIALAFGAVLGHVFTPYARFRGGKGVATAAGAMLALDPMAVGIAMLIWLLVFVLFRRVSIGSLVAALAVPVTMLVLGGRPWSLFAATILLFLFLVYTHRDNIQRLLRGQEQPIV